MYKWSFPAAPSDLQSHEQRTPTSSGVKSAMFSYPFLAKYVRAVRSQYCQAAVGYSVQPKILLPSFAYIVLPGWKKNVPKMFMIS